MIALEGSAQKTLMSLKDKNTPQKNKKKKQRMKKTSVMRSYSAIIQRKYITNTYSFFNQAILYAEKHGQTSLYVKSMCCAFVISQFLSAKLL